VIPTSITVAEQNLRRAIERRQVGDVAKYFAAYAQVAEYQFKLLCPSDPIRLQISERVLSVLAWTTLMLHTQRAILADDLRAMQRANNFLGANLSAGSRFHRDL
jgi:hypothetical protein